MLNTATSCFISKVALKHSHATCFHVFHGSIHTTTAEVKSCEKPYGPQRLKCLLSDLSQKNVLPLYKIKEE